MNILHSFWYENKIRKPRQILYENKQTNIITRVIVQIITIIPKMIKLTKYLYYYNHINMQ